MHLRLQGSEWQYLGKHRVRLSRDTIFLRTLGEIELAEVSALHELRLEIYFREGLVFCVIDAEGGGSMNAAVRRSVADYNLRFPCRGGNTIYGTTMLVRTAARLALGATKLIARPNISTVFVRDQQAALDWVSKRRSALKVGDKERDLRAI